MDIQLDRAPLTPDRRPGLYVHVPFCSRICPYCDFSVVGARHPGRVDFVDLLLREAESWSRSWKRRDPGHQTEATDGSEAFGTVYFGGGTPSTLKPDEMIRLFDGLRERLAIAEDAVWTLEANPEHVDEKFSELLVELGVDHISLGVQSLDRKQLVELGRSHGPRDVEVAVGRLRTAGARWISIDLIYAVDSDIENWRWQLQQAVGLEPEHLSCYELTLHEGTRFGREAAMGQRSVVDEGRRLEMFLLTLERLSAAGYDVYEVSNFARGRSNRSPHNQKYWSGCEYLGLGPSAHSHRGHQRWWNCRSLRDWRSGVRTARAAVEERETLEPSEILLERLMMGTRTVPGLDLGLLRDELGVDLAESSAEAIAGLEKAGRIHWHGPDRLVPTVAGLATADQLAIDLFPEAC